MIYIVMDTRLSPDAYIDGRVRRSVYLDLCQCRGVGEKFLLVGAPCSTNCLHLFHACYLPYDYDPDMYVRIFLANHEVLAPSPQASLLSNKAKGKEVVQIALVVPENSCNVSHHYWPRRSRQTPTAKIFNYYYTCMHRESVLMFSIV